MSERVLCIAYSQLITVSRAVQTRMGRSMPTYIKVANEGRNAYKMRINDTQNIVQTIHSRYI